MGSPWAAPCSHPKKMEAAYLGFEKLRKCLLGSRINIPRKVTNIELVAETSFPYVCKTHRRCILMCHMFQSSTHIGWWRRQQGTRDCADRPTRPKVGVAGKTALCAKLGTTSHWTFPRPNPIWFSFYHNPPTPLERRVCRNKHGNTHANKQTHSHRKFVFVCLCVCLSEGPGSVPERKIRPRNTPGCLEETIAFFTALYD